MSQPPATRPLHRALFALGVAALASLCLAQGVPPAAGTAAPAASAASAPRAAARPNGQGARGISRQATRPQWRELGPAQQKALAPLAPKWDTLNEPQKRKWLAMSSNFSRMAPEEQAKLHSRMTEWVSLSPQQRIQARLNYGEARKIPADDKRAKWEAYQQLSPEEKRRLAAAAPKAPVTAAAAVRPVAPGKLAAVPHPRASAPLVEGRSPRIAVAPHQLDHNTLLPQPAPAHEAAGAR